MTFREKLKQEHPQYVSDVFGGGCISCPSVFGYEAARPAECDNDAITCHDCWSREMPEKGEKIGGMV